jgi:hypothetical protein
MLTLLTLLGIFGAPPAPPAAPANPWAEPTRGILAQRCGQCHLPNLPTSVPRALAVFDLTEEPWYGRLTHDQFDDLLKRVRGVRSIPQADQVIVERFVLCARDQACSPAAP